MPNNVNCCSIQHRCSNAMKETGRCTYEMIDPETDTCYFHIETIHIFDDECMNKRAQAEALSEELQYFFDSFHEINETSTEGLLVRLLKAEARDNIKKDQKREKGVQDGIDSET